MNPNSICAGLVEAGYNAKLIENQKKLAVTFTVSTRLVTLVHVFPAEMLRIPKFCLVSGHDFGKLAHVGVDRNGGAGEVCIGDAGSISVNTDRPELVYRDTVKRNVELLTRLIKDPAYNQQEQLREFQAHWEILCRKEDHGINEVSVAWDSRESESLQVKVAEKTTGTSMRTGHIALSSALATGSRLTAFREWVRWGKRPTRGQALALRLSDLKSVPATKEELLPWYFDAVHRADTKGQQGLKRLQKKKNAVYWLVFAAEIPGGDTVFAIRWQSTCKGGLPVSEEEVRRERWKATPHRVRSLSRESLVPRGGGTLDLKDMSILLVGCGSVGSEVAHLLTSAGVGHLTISDPEALSEENLYRHMLGIRHIGMSKSEAVAAELALKHPWTEIVHWTERLERLRDKGKLGAFNLVVIAIGSQAIERKFAEYCRDQGVNVATVNCWLEGYGIGGHAILVVSGSKGCWHCAYVDPKTLRRGLASNLSFLQPKQIVMRNHGGCGTQFLPYNGIAAKYTAAMAADLAVRFLLGEVTQSSKVSWKGSSAQAKSASLKVTYRYRHFKESLQVRALYNDHCDFCGD